MKEGNYEELYKNNISVDDVEKNCMLFEKRWLQKFYEVVDAVFHHFIVEDKLDYYISIFEKDIKDDELILDVDENTEKRFCKTDIEKKLDEKEKKEFQAAYEYAEKSIRCRDSLEMNNKVGYISNLNAFQE